MKEFIEFCRRSDDGCGYYVYEILESAKERGLIRDFEEVDSVSGDQRRWGSDRQIIFKIDENKYILFDIYFMSGNNDDHELNDVYEVSPVETTTITWHHKP